jgi:hypothetical protein
MKLFRKASGDENKIMLWLNFVEPVDLENMVGSMPKTKRTARAALKQQDPDMDIEDETA